MPFTPDRDLIDEKWCAVIRERNSSSKAYQELRHGAINHVKHAEKPHRTSRSLLYLLVGSTLLTFLLLEGGLQLYTRLQQGTWLWQNTASRIGYTQPVADRRQYALQPHYVDAAQGLTINARGFRGALLAKEVPSIVAALGDSVPFGAGVRDDETYPARLDTVLASIMPGTRVLNAGVPSYNMRQSFDRLRHDVLKHYDKQLTVVTVQAANDVSLLTWYRQAWTPEVTWAGLWWKRFRTSALLHYTMPAFTATQPAQHLAYSGTAMLAALRHTLHELATFCASRHLRVVLLPIDPFYYQTRHRSKNPTLPNWQTYDEIFTMWDQLITDVNDALLALSQQHAHVTFFDTRPLFDEEDRSRMYLDFIHYTPEGHRFLATALGHFLHAQAILAAR